MPTIKQTLKKIDALLVEKAKLISGRRGDAYNHMLFSQMNPARLTDAERRSCNVYLFGPYWDRATKSDLEMIV